MVDKAAGGITGRPGGNVTTMEPDKTGRPGVYARLAEEAEVERTVLRPPRGTRLVGWLVCAAIVATVVAAAFGAHPW
jgi:hypothetical protein